MLRVYFFVAEHSANCKKGGVKPHYPLILPAFGSSKRGFRPKWEREKIESREFIIKLSFQKPFFSILKVDFYVAGFFFI